MLISTKGRYGLLAMCRLAINYGGQPLSIKEIAEERNFSTSYLEQLFATLKRAGLVYSTRGARGGYRLAKAPESITAGDVLRALEGPLMISECIDKENLNACDNTFTCITRPFWCKLQNCIEEVLDSVTLIDLIEKDGNLQVETQTQEQDDK